MNCAAAAAGVFGNVRIPAMLLAGAAMGQLWTKLGNDDGNDDHPVLNTVYTLALSLTVVVEFLAVFLGTAMGVRLYAGGFDPMAANAVALLVREFELPYICVRFCFFTGFMAFMLAVTARACTTFKPALAKSTALLCASGLLTMVNFFNYTVVDYEYGYVGLLWRIVLLCESQCTLRNPLALAAIFCLAGSVVFAVQSIRGANGASSSSA